MKENSTEHIVFHFLLVSKHHSQSTQCQVTYYILVVLLLLLVPVQKPVCRLEGQLKSKKQMDHSFTCSPDSKTAEQVW